MFVLRQYSHKSGFAPCTFVLLDLEEQTRSFSLRGQLIQKPTRDLQEYLTFNKSEQTDLNLEISKEEMYATDDN